MKGVEKQASHNYKYQYYPDIRRVYTPGEDHSDTLRPPPPLRA